MNKPLETSLAPWLSVSNGTQAVAYYQRAFDAVEGYRLDDDTGNVIVARLQVGTAEFWVQDDPDASPGNASIRLILTVADPDARFAQAIAAGATEVAAVHDEHGWRTGRVTDPFGHDWEFSRPSAQG